MVLATLTTIGGHLNAHPDLIARFYQMMETVAKEAKERDQYQANMKRSEDAAHFRDR